MKIVSSPLADPDAAARKLVELANAVEPVQDGRIHIEKINGPLLYQLKGTRKMRMGATHFLTKTLPKVAAEMAMHVLAYNLTRVMNIVGIKPLLAAIRA